MKKFNRCGYFVWMGMLLVLVSGCGTIRKHPDFNTRAPEIRKVAVMPPQIVIERVAFKGNNELLYDEMQAAEKKVRADLENEFQKRQYAVNAFEINESLKAQDPEVGTEWGKLKEKYAHLVADFCNQFAAKMKYKDFRLSLGSDVNSFADRTGADVLIFSTGSGFVNSGGENTKNFTKSLLIGVLSGGRMIPIYNTHGGTIHVSVVDGDNGEILWHNFTPANKVYDLTDGDSIHKMIHSVLAKYPAKGAL